VAEYYDRYTSLGFEIVAVGKAPSSLAHYNRYATPDASPRMRSAWASIRISW